LLEVAERARRLGVALVALGIGLEWDRDTLGQLASISGGSCAFLDDPGYLTPTLTDLVERLRRTLASRLRLTLEPAPGVSVLRAAQMAPQLVSAFEGPHTPGAPVTVELGALAGGPDARSSVTLWEMLLEPSTLTAGADGQLELGVMRSSYWALWQDGGRIMRAQAPLRTPLSASATHMEPDVRLAVELLTASRLQIRADHLVAGGDLEEAREALETAALRLASAGEAHLAEDARQTALALFDGDEVGTIIAALRLRYTLRNQSPFQQLRRTRGG
jgi:hypothetical protein